MPQERTAGRPTTRRYSVEEKQAAVRMVRALQAETGDDARGGPTGRRAARIRDRVGPHVGASKRTSMTECGPGVTTGESARVRDLEQEVRELRRANEILKRAAVFFGAELDRQQRR